MNHIVINYKDKIEFIYFDTIAYDISDILINELENKFTIINEKQIKVINENF